MHGFRAADRQVGGGHLYATVLSYLQTAVAPRLFGVAGGSQQNIFVAASGLTEMAGWMAHDAGRDEAAGQHFQRSLGLASAGGDGQLTAHVIGSMSHLALHQGESARAVSFARLGQEVLAQAPPHPGLAARLLALEARGLAALPQPEHAECAKVMLRAEQALDQDHTEPPSPWTSRFDEGSLASEAARSLRQLGQLEAAARYARRIIEVRPGTHARSRAFGQLLLASILVTQGEPEAACAAAQQALDATHTLSSCVLVQHFRDLAKLLEPYEASSAVAAFLAAVRVAVRERSWLYTLLGTGTGNHPAQMEPGQ